MDARQARFHQDIGFVIAMAQSYGKLLSPDDDRRKTVDMICDRLWNEAGKATIVFDAVSAYPKEMI